MLIKLQNLLASVCQSEAEAPFASIVTSADQVLLAIPAPSCLQHLF